MARRCHRLQAAGTPAFGEVPAMTQLDDAPRSTRPHASGTPEQRVELGKAARRTVPRSSHAGFTVRPDRPDPLTLLAGQDDAPVPELVPVRHGLMASSAFAFFRGAALPMAADLAATPRT